MVHLACVAYVGSMSALPNKAQYIRWRYPFDELHRFNIWDADTEKDTKMLVEQETLTLAEFPAMQPLSTESLSQQPGTH